MSFERIAVIGAGAWGIALANALARAGRSVTLWARDPAAAEALQRHRESVRLPGVKLEPQVVATNDLAAACASEALLFAVPAQALREVTGAASRAVAAQTPAVICAKGIERDTGRFMSEIVEETIPHAVVAMLSGPSFATDVARGLPTAVTLAVRDDALARALASACGSTTFRPYHSTDVRGVEIGGAAKNVLAIAAGIVTGRNLGASAAAALITRGFAELMRFGTACGARAETLTGLSGLGDLVLTCSSPQSRNFAFGVALGRGAPADSASGGKLVEGAFTASVLATLAREKSVDMPIVDAVSAVLNGSLGIDAAIESLLRRPFKPEV